MQLLYIFLTIYNALRIAVMHYFKRIFKNVIIYAYPQCEQHKFNRTISNIIKTNSEELTDKRTVGKLGSCISSLRVDRIMRTQTMGNVLPI